MFLYVLESGLRSFQGFRSSVRYFGASACAFARNAFCADSSSFGGDSVRLATGTPTAMKNSSWPAGEHMHNSRTGRPEAFRKKCGALAGMLTVSPPPTPVFAPRKE